MHLGRTQLGRELPLTVTTRDQFGTPTVPDTVPVAVILGSNGVVVMQVQVPILSRTVQPGMFSEKLLLDGTFKLGRYFVLYQWTCGFYVGRDSDVFDIVGGGNDAGAVHSMHWVIQPHASFVYYETADGQIHRGVTQRLRAE
jgi:hypothetical protein